MTRSAAICRYITTDAKVETLGLEFTQYKFKLKLEDLTGKVILPGQLKIKAREDGEEVATYVKFPCHEHIALIPPHELRGYGAFQKRGEWMICQHRAEKGEEETWEEFCKRCRLLLGDALWRISEASSGASSLGLQLLSVFA